MITSRLNIHWGLKKFLCCMIVLKRKIEDIKHYLHPLIVDHVFYGHLQGCHLVPTLIAARGRSQSRERRYTAPPESQDIF